MLIQIFGWLFVTLSFVISLFFIKNNGEVLFPLQEEKNKQLPFSRKVKIYGFILLVATINLATMLIFFNNFSVLIAVLIICMIIAIFTFSLIRFLKID